jgi:hypothetical protein
MLFRRSAFAVPLQYLKKAKTSTGADYFNGENIANLMSEWFKASRHG